jgi:hypothetical protein
MNPELEQVLRGMAAWRRYLLSDEPITPEARADLVQILNFYEDAILAMVQAQEAFKRLKHAQDYA